jgi:hypothetical protein
MFITVNHRTRWRGGEIEREKGGMEREKGGIEREGRDGEGEREVREKPSSA